MTMFRSIALGLFAFAVTSALILAEARLFDAAVAG